MILTGETKLDFERWLHSNDALIKDGIYDDTYLTDVFEDLPLNLQYALIIEWFDSVGIYVNSDYFELNKGFYSEVLDSNFEIIKPTRQEALTEAIKKAIENIKKQYEVKEENDIATKANRLFLERLRKKYGIKLTHWGITELGSKKGRIHIHGIFFIKGDSRLYINLYCGGQWR